MKTKVEKIQSDKGCAEVCTIIHEGREFTAMGASVWEDESGKLRGILYADDSNCQQDRPGTIAKRETYLTSWDGQVKVFATIGSTWQNSFLDYHGRHQENRSYYFTVKGRKCRGVNYNRQWSQVVRFKEI